jgi:ABC-2 type transport system permease protein
MTGNSAFELVSERGWRRGLGNLMGAGFAAWFRTNTWWTFGGAWTIVTVAIMAGAIFSTDGSEPGLGLMIYGLSAGLFATIAVVITVMSEIVGEKQSGTAAWILSKPVSRSAFIVAKLIPNAVGLLVCLVVMPGIAAYIMLSLTGTGLDPLGFLAGMGVLGLHLLFYLTLTVMLGTLFDRRGAVIAIPLAIAFGQQLLLGLGQVVRQILPYMLVMPTPDGDPSVFGTLAMGQQPDSYLAIFFVSLCIVAFVAVSIWRFEQEEF